VEAVGADDEVEVFFRAVGGSDAGAVGVLFDVVDGAAEACLDALAGVEDGGGDVASGDAEELIVEEFSDRLGVHGGDGSTLGVDKAEFVDHVALLAEGGDEAHAFGDLEADTPEVDDVAAGAEFRGDFEEDGVVAVVAEPPGEGGSCDAGAVDGDSHGGLAPRIAGSVGGGGVAPGGVRLVGAAAEWIDALTGGDRRAVRR